MSELTRKDFIRRSAVLGAVGVGASAVLAYCGGRPPAEDEGEVAEAASACGDISGLSDAEKQQRQAMTTNLKYVEKSEIAGQMCNNCQLYKEPAGGSACGGCQLFPGPVAAEGHCASWAAKVG